MRQKYYVDIEAFRAISVVEKADGTNDGQTIASICPVVAFKQKWYETEIINGFDGFLASSSD